MENMNGVGGPFYMGEYGMGVGSMMTLMTEQDQPANGESMTSTITMTIPPASQSCSSTFSYGHGHVEGLLSTIFHGGGGDQISLAGHHHHNEKHLVGGHFRPEQLILNKQVAVVSDSSLSSVKTEATSHQHMEFHTKEDAGGEGELRSHCPQPFLVIRESRSRKEQQGSRMVSSIDVESACSSNPNDSIKAMKARIAGHPHYPRLQAAYMDCQKIGAPPDVVEVLKDIGKDNQQGLRSPKINIGADPELDQFMEAYCDILGKLQIELNKPFKEAMAFVNKVEAELNCLGVAALRNFPPGHSDEREDGGGSSEGEFSCGEADPHELDPHSQDKELKDQLLRKYSGYFSSLKQEFLKKKKKGKLPKEARLKLLEWWNLHYKWPYPSETDKVALAESTGLDQKQINNWFINQRKRHWKPSEDMKYVVMDSLNPHGASFFIDPNEG